MPFTDFDHRMMRRALELAELGRYSTHPNPRVGCVIVNAERIVGEGWHRKWGEAHAEPIALAAAGTASRGSTVYVTLEPHSFHGKTPPCTDALIRAGVQRVVCAALDPNPKVSGQGIEQLRAAGIEVHTGLLEQEAHRLNRGFDKRMRTGMPRVVLKLAASLDGRIALANGESRWITGSAARADVHRLRAESSAILTGIGTVIRDDPQLTVRDDSIDLAGRVPLRAVIDTHLRMPLDARMLRERGETLVFTTRPGDASEAQALRSAGAEPITVAGAKGAVDLRAVLEVLGARLCNDVLVEAGPTLADSLLEDKLVDELVLYLAPKMLGADGQPLTTLSGLSSLEAAPNFELHEVQRLGSDLKLVYTPIA